ncbi:related to cobalt accumulation protein COT1 [Cephalotrichum gorgonifer]|uniref:Related to cobalt accumulation protein COT1 n=1 Tax=Cephalotrichum gorgonifer TaxID=2041049 RepID=A0AAE8MWR8_9PEZI|nr:related to cobalt accumulation protein COT1 [Cephalotrichum gorgonifer]
MVVICTVFFFVELISGYLIHSLALLADAFHMLNDIISLLVGLWAVSVARRATTDKFSYGWLRAEILGAFFNATFLIALCVSIVLEAVTRFFDPPEIENPKVMLIVGCFGLASNLVGFVILGGHGHGHDHGHDEGDNHAHGHGHHHDHDHGIEAGNEHRLAEEGRGSVARTNADVADERGDPMDVLPHVAVARASSVPPRTPAQQGTEEDDGPDARDAEARHSSTAARGRSRRRTTGPAHHGRLASIEDISIYPSSFRQEIIDASRSNTSFGQPVRSSSSSSESGPDERTALLGNAGTTSKAQYRTSSPVRRPRRDSEALHTDHHHNKPKSKGKGGGHGHSHGDMGMNAMVLHVLGDALGNVGVIITALVIWLTEWRYKLYTDPIVSLFITVIILRSALPLTSATARVLLQATPEHIDINELRQDIQTLPGVLSCHHIHVWQLSDTKIVASMHMQVSFPISEEGGEKYMELAKRARKCLHAYGIHSATIQPEFCPDKSQHVEFVPTRRGPPSVDGPGDQPAAAPGTEDGRVPMCLLECVEDCDEEGCCSVLSSSSHTQGHPHGDGHEHNHSH